MAVQNTRLSSGFGMGPIPHGAASHEEFQRVTTNFEYLPTQGPPCLLGNSRKVPRHARWIFHRKVPRSPPQTAVGGKTASPQTATSGRATGPLGAKCAEVQRQVRSAVRRSPCSPTTRRAERAVQLSFSASDALCSQYPAHRAPVPDHHAARCSASAARHALIVPCAHGALCAPPIALPTAQRTDREVDRPLCERGLQSPIKTEPASQGEVSLPADRSPTCLAGSCQVAACCWVVPDAHSNQCSNAKKLCHVMSDADE